jgi:hypothetical protein
MAIVLCEDEEVQVKVAQHNGECIEVVYKGVHFSIVVEEPRRNGSQNKSIKVEPDVRVLVDIDRQPLSFDGQEVQMLMSKARKLQALRDAYAILRCEGP